MVKRKSQCSIRATVRGKVDFCFSRRRVKKAEVLVRGTVEVSESDGDRPPFFASAENVGNHGEPKEKYMVIWSPLARLQKLQFNF